MYVDVEVFKTERQLHPHLPYLPPVVIAKLVKLPSPQEKEAQEQASRKRGGKKDEAGEEKERGEVGQWKGNCFVRVVCINRKANLVDDAWNTAADTLLSAQPLVWGRCLVTDRRADRQAGRQTD